MQLLTDWEKTRYGQIKFITENKEKQLEITAENFKKNSIRELRLKFEIESERALISIIKRNYFVFLQHFLRIVSHTSKS